MLTHLLMNPRRSAEPAWEPVRYYPDTDTMAIELRPWPGHPNETAVAYDAAPDLVIHDAPDGAPWLWERARLAAPRAYCGGARCAAASAAGSGIDDL
jgi:hypothetical protein